MGGYQYEWFEDDGIKLSLILFTLRVVVLTCVATFGVLVSNLVWTVSISSDLHIWAGLWSWSSP